MSFTTPPSGSERLGPGRSSTDRVWLFQFEPDGAGAGFWGFSGLLRKMLGFRFLLGIFVICSPSVVLSLGVGGCVLGWDERWGFEHAISFSSRFPPSLTFLRRLSFSSLWYKSQGKKRSVKQYFPPEKSLPGQLSGNPHLFVRTFLTLRRREEGCYLFFPLVIDLFFF